MPTPVISAAYVCYMRRAAGGTPYLEVLADYSRSGAVRAAARLLQEHPDCVSIDLWQDDDMIFSLSRTDLGAIDSERSAA